MKRIFTLFFIPLAPTYAHAVGGCYEPTVPYCLTSSSTFEDEHSFESCKRGMDQFEQEVADHSQCLKNWIDDEVRQAQNQDANAQSEYENSVNYWNCKANDPTRFCPSP